MRTPCGRKPYLRLLDRCFLPALTAFTLGQDLIVLLFLTTFAYLLMHQNRDLPAGAVTISNDDQLSLAMDHIASSGIGIATGKLIAFRCALMIGACLRIVQFLSWKLPFAEAEVSVLPPFLLSTFRQCENHPRASAKLIVCFYPADIPIRSPHETPHPRPAARVVRYRLRLERQPQRNFPAFLQWDGLCRRLSDDHTGSRSSHPHVQESLEPRQWHNSV